MDLNGLIWEYTYDEGEQRVQLGRNCIWYGAGGTYFHDGTLISPFVA